MQIQVKEAIAYEGPAVQYMGEDGYPTALIMPVLVAVARDGRWFQLPNGIVSTTTSMATCMSAPVGTSARPATWPPKSTTESSSTTSIGSR